MSSGDTVRALDTLSGLTSHLDVGQVLPDEAVTVATAHPQLAARMGLGASEDGRWVRARAPRWRLEWLRETAYGQWHHLFAAAFGHAMTPALFAWKYRNAQPAGVGVWSGESLVAFYGGMPRRILYKGAATMAVQIGDVMVEPSQRGVLTRSGPFQMAAATYLELCIGTDKAHLLGFGFPSDKAFRVAQRQGLYEAVDTLVALHWTAQKRSLPWHCEAVPLDNANVARVESAWRAMAAELTHSVVGVRDARYVRERYLEHPDKPYLCRLVRRRFTRHPLGVVVMRNRHGEGLELVDLIAAPRHFGLLLAVARTEAADAGLTHVNAWITASHAHWLRTPEATQSTLDVTIPSNVWSPGPAVTDVKDRWWLMAGDTDFR